MSGCAGPRRARCWARLRREGIGVRLAQRLAAQREGAAVQGDGLIERARRLVGGCEVVSGGEGVGVVLSKDAHAVGEHLLEQGNGFVQAARRLVGVCEVVAGGERAGVVLSKDAHAVGEHPLEQGDRRAQAARRPVGAREVVTGREGVGVVRPQDAHTVGEHLFVQGDRLAQAPRRIVGARQVALGGEGVGVVRPQDTRTVGEHLLVQGDRLAQAPRRLVGVCEVVAGGEGVGVVRPQDLHLVGEHLLVQGDGLAQAPRRLVSAREVVAGGEGVGVVLSQDARTVGGHLLVQGDRLAQAARRLVGAREAMTGGEAVGVLGAQDLLDDTHSAPERQRLVGKTKIPRVEEDMGKVSHDPFTLEQGTGIALGGDRAKLVDEIPGLPTAPVRVLTRQAAYVHLVEHIRRRVERLSPFLPVPVLAQHLPLKPVQHRHAPVGGLLDHRRVEQRRQREMCLLGSGITGLRVFARRPRTRVLVRLIRARALGRLVVLRSGVDPPCGHPGLSEHSERPDLEAGHPTQSAPDATEGGVHSQQQRPGHVISIRIPRNGADHLLTGILLQALQVPPQRPPLIGRSRRRLRNRQRQIPQAPRHSIGGLHVPRTHRVQKVGDGLLTGEHAHTHPLPPLGPPPAPAPSRGHHPQTNTTRNHTQQILDPLHIVEHHQPVTRLSRLQVVEAPPNRLILSGTVAHVNAQPAGELHQITPHRRRRRSIEPRHQTPPRSPAPLRQA